MDDLSFWTFSIVPDIFTVTKVHIFFEICRVSLIKVAKCRRNFCKPPPSSHIYTMPTLFVLAYIINEHRGRGRGRPRPRKTMSLPFCPVRGASIVWGFLCHCPLWGIAGEDAHVPGFGARNMHKSMHIISDTPKKVQKCYSVCGFFSNFATQITN